MSSWQPATGCGAFPQALAVPSATVTFRDIATDTDSLTAGNQAGVFAQRYVGVLVRVSSVKVASGPEAGVTSP